MRYFLVLLMCISSAAAQLREPKLGSKPLPVSVVVVYAENGRAVSSEVLTLPTETTMFQLAANPRRYGCKGRFDSVRGFVEVRRLPREYSDPGTVIRMNWADIFQNEKAKFLLDRGDVIFSDAWSDLR